MNRSISSKLIALLTLSLAVVITIGVVIDYRLSRAEILSRLQLESSETISAAVTDMENWLGGIKGSTLFLARILQQRDYSQPGLNQMLRDIVENNEDIFGAAIALNPQRLEQAGGFATYHFRKEGLLAQVDLAQGSGKPYWTRNWYAAPVNAGKPVWVEPYFDYYGAEVLMTTFSVPVFRTDDDGQQYLYAVVTADVSLDELQQYLRQLKLGKSGYGILMSQKGIVLSAKNPAFIMQHYRDTGSAEPELSIWGSMVSAALTGQSQTRELECQEFPGKCLAHMSVLRSTGWPVGIIYSEDELLLPLQKYTMKIALTGLITLLIMALAVSVVSRRLTRHLTALVGVTDELARGNFDVGLPAIRGQDEVARLTLSFLAMKQELKTYITNLEKATAARSRLEGELSAAREIQMSMVPQDGQAYERKADFSLWATLRPAKTVGGDLYTYSIESDGKLLLAVGDVSDKGVPAALFMAKTISHIQQYNQVFMDPAEGMHELNNALETGNSNCMFVTLFFGVLDLQSGHLLFASAGHTPPRLIREGVVHRVAQESGPALGLAPDLEFPENRIQLQHGDRLVIYTDGIDEAFNEKAQMFGTQGLDLALEQTHADDLELAGGSIIQAVDTFAGTTAQSDDITLMLLDFSPAEGANQPLRLHQAFCIDSSGVSRVLEWLEDQLGKIVAEQSLIMELVLVGEEVVSNIGKYAQLPPGSEITVSLEVRSEEIHMVFSDEGVPFNPLLDASKATLGEDTESARIGGLGVHLILNLSDQQHYQRSGGRNILHVSKSLN